MSARAKGTPMIASAKDVAERVKAIDGERVSRDLNAYGSAMIKRLITLAECEALAKLYQEDGIFRSRVVMAQHSFGRGDSTNILAIHFQTSLMALGQPSTPF